MMMITVATAKMTENGEGEEGNVMRDETSMKGEEMEVMEEEEMEETMETMKGDRTEREDDDITDMNLMFQFP
jgi:hypothetical protein